MKLFYLESVTLSGPQIRGFKLLNLNIYIHVCLKIILHFIYIVLKKVYTYSTIFLYTGTSLCPEQ